MRMPLTYITHAILASSYDTSLVGSNMCCKQAHIKSEQNVHMRTFILASAEQNPRASVDAWVVVCM